MTVRRIHGFNGLYCKTILCEGKRVNLVSCCRWLGTAKDIGSGGQRLTTLRFKDDSSCTSSSSDSAFWSVLLRSINLYGRWCFNFLSYFRVVILPSWAFVAPCFVGSLALVTCNCSAFSVFGDLGLSTLFTARFSLTAFGTMFVSVVGITLYYLGSFRSMSLIIDAKATLGPQGINWIPCLVFVELRRIGLHFGGWLLNICVSLWLCRFRRYGFRL